MATSQENVNVEYGVGMSQDDFMRRDECLVINYNDEVIGTDNKYNVHKFVTGQAKGILHRAFSVMLFDGQERLLLQQRALCKVTFPKVWTNTCCSHPLHGQTPCEADPPRTARSTEPVGIRRAAIRKLKHELGIEPSDLKNAKFKYMGRVHYWAADTVTHGSTSPWGEHEIDYLLLVRLPADFELPLRPNSEEVMDTAWVSADELKGMMMQPDLLWSPWFRVIASALLFDWWADLDKAWQLEPFLPIQRFDPPAEHRKVGGCHDEPVATELGDLHAAELKLKWESDERRALTLSTETDARKRDLTLVTHTLGKVKGLKQGGYGKVRTHHHSKFDQLRFSEICAALSLKWGPGRLHSNISAEILADPDVKFCDDKLGQVSRSFAMVIRCLPRKVVLDVLIFYLVLRGLDTIEDDMETFKGNADLKCDHLRKFGSLYLGDPEWKLGGVGEGDEEALLSGFGAVSRVFNSLPPTSQEVIRDITLRMGAGMADNVGVDMGQGTSDLAAYALYCHAVAGLVGEGLTRIFIASGLVDESAAGQGQQVWPFCKSVEQSDGQTYGLANSMGLFLQKSNIIRDFLEDYVDGRAFWPQQEWKRFARTSELGEFARPTSHGAGLYAGAYDANHDPPGAQIIGKGVNVNAISCLNFLVADALELVPDCLEWLARISEPQIFRFGAVPQVMAIATLAECFNNPKVFSGVVKIRKGMAAKLVLSSNSIANVHRWFYFFALDIEKRCPATDPSRDKLIAATAAICKFTADMANAKRWELFVHMCVLGSIVVALFAMAFAVLLFN
eukprot:CAMPEP_0119304092 /NCGR_PEP_ID=MMETSP1333-20130426/5399_1 /TAXON_ID=418940 /ORGANISM="Scyphosphaera apsteinii, Strain RCC1455" /LENGTH=788 /DNA_ID=CAMNT_0007306909 /DNA_START=55 /DNA_END=2421 /DNA_ORIENTATION=+